jgi:hypothetical protein
VILLFGVVFGAILRKKGKSNLVTILVSNSGLKFKEGRPLTKDFMHIMNTALFESFFEVVRHNMSKEEAMEYIDLLEKYHSAGWSVIYDECK